MMLERNLQLSNSTSALKYKYLLKPTNFHSHRKIAGKPRHRKEVLWIDYKDPNQKEDGTPFRFTGKERDLETGLYYYGARYLDPKTSRWLGVDPAMHQGDYIPSAPIDDEAKKRNGNLPGQGGIFNYVNMHVYHYAGNNPVRYVDPDGKWLAFYKQVQRFKELYEAAAQYNELPSDIKSPEGVTYYRFSSRQLRDQAENREKMDLKPSGNLSTNSRRDARAIGLKEKTEINNYINGVMSRYRAFKKLREDSYHIESFENIVESANDEYNRVLKGRDTPEAKMEASKAAYDVIDNFIKKRDPNYKLNNNKESL